MNKKIVCRNGTVELKDNRLNISLENLCSIRIEDEDIFYFGDGIHLSCNLETGKVAGNILSQLAFMGLFIAPLMGNMKIVPTDDGKKYLAPATDDMLENFNNEINQCIRTIDKMSHVLQHMVQTIGSGEIGDAEDFMEFIEKILRDMEGEEGENLPESG